MNNTQLDIHISQKIIDDNPQYRFLKTLLPLYVSYKRTRRAAGNSELTLIHGWIARYKNSKLLIHRESFYIDEQDYVVVQKAESESAWYLGLRGCEKPDELINFNHVKKVSPHSMMFYELGDTVPTPASLEYLEIGN